MVQRVSDITNRKNTTSTAYTALVVDKNLIPFYAPYQTLYIYIYIQLKPVEEVSRYKFIKALCENRLHNERTLTYVTPNKVRRYGNGKQMCHLQYNSTMVTKPLKMLL